MRSPSVEGCEVGGVWPLTRWAVWSRRARDADVVWEYFILIDSDSDGLFSTEQMER